MIGCLPTQALAFLAVFVYATHATQAIAFEWKPGLSRLSRERDQLSPQLSFRVYRDYSIGVDPWGSASLNPHNKLVVRVLYGLDPHNNVTTE